MKGTPLSGKNGKRQWDEKWNIKVPNQLMVTVEKTRNHSDLSSWRWLSMRHRHSSPCHVPVVGSSLWTMRMAIVATIGLLGFRQVIVVRNNGDTTTIQQWRLDSGWLPNFIVWIINQAPLCVVGNILRHLKDESIGFSHSFDSRETYPLQQNAGTVCQSLETPSPSVRRR